MKIHGFCLFVLLSTSSAVQAQPTLAKESDENLDKQVKALEQQIKVLQDQVDKLRKQQAPLRAEQAARAAKLRELEAKTHFAKAEIGGTLRKLVGSDRLAVRGYRSTDHLPVAIWQVVVNYRSWEVRFPEKDKELLAAAEKLINKRVIITGTASYTQQEEPALAFDGSYGPGGYSPGYRPPPSYLFVVSAKSLQPATDDKEIQQRVKDVQARIDSLRAKGDDITKREMSELHGLYVKVEELGKELEARQNYAKVQFCGKLLTGRRVLQLYSGQGGGPWPMPHGWQVQIGFSHSWNLDFGQKNPLEALAKEQEGKRVVITGTILVDSSVCPTVNVESLKRAEE